LFSLPLHSRSPLPTLSSIRFSSSPEIFPNGIELNGRTVFFCLREKNAGKMVEMNEIELKILEINRSAVLKRLRRLRARKIFSGLLKSVYFDFPKNELRKKSQVLRLRSMKEKTFLTFKTKIPVPGSVFSEEIEFEVSDFKKAGHFLEHLGFIPILSYEKKRTSYRFGTVRIEFDQWLGKFKKIPLYLELEAHSEKELFIALKKIGFSKKDAKAWHTGKLLEHYGFRI
jgi:adenylate cyclase class 2